MSHLQHQYSLADSERASAQLEDLIVNIHGESDTFNGLMREHLEAAHACSVGSMPEEYALNLKLAGDLLPNIEDDALRNRIAGFLQSQQPHSR